MDSKLYAIGDSWNDLPMLDRVKNSYTFHYASLDIQSHAKEIVSSVSEYIENIIPNS